LGIIYSIGFAQNTIRGVIMACIRCQSQNQREFPADIKLYFNANRTSVPFTPAKREIAICLACGCFDFTLEQNELDVLREGAGE
jgi:hypothetical protein